MTMKARVTFQTERRTGLSEIDEWEIEELKCQRNEPIDRRYPTERENNNSSFDSSSITNRSIDEEEMKLRMDDERCREIPSNDFNNSTGWIHADKKQ